MLLSHNELIKLVEQGVINAPLENINGTSIDITLDNIIRVEDEIDRYFDPVDLTAKDNIATNEVIISEDGFILYPNEFILASSVEVFNLPNNISAEYKLKSSMARNGLEHLNAGWCDPTWNGSKLTLEFKNMTRNHPLLIRAGMKIGQMIFLKSEPVPEHASYAKKGQYNGQTKVTESKGIK